MSRLASWFLPAFIFAMAVGAVAWSAPPASQPASKPSTRPKYPDVSGIWHEDIETVTVSQTNGEFVGKTPTENGDVRWQFRGLITPAGKVKGTLRWVNAPKDAKPQQREGELSADGETISGRARTEGTAWRPFKWTRRDESQAEVIRASSKPAEAPKPTITTKYDRFKDTTTIETQEMAIDEISPDLPNLWLQVSAIFKGKEVTGQMPTCALLISGIGNWGFDPGDTLILLADGNRVRLEAIATTNSTALFPVSTQQMLILGSAKKIEGQIHTKEFLLKPDQNALIVEFCKQTRLGK